MDAYELCAKYQTALTDKDLVGIMELFTRDAVIHAPISGKAGVEQFHTYLFEKTKKNLAKFSSVLGRRDTPCNITLHFCYTFSVGNGQVSVIDGVMRLQIDEELNKIKRVSIVYNPAEMRAFMAEVGIEPLATGADVPKSYQVGR